MIQSDSIRIQFNQNLKVFETIEHFKGAFSFRLNACVCFKIGIKPRSAICVSNHEKQAQHCYFYFDDSNNNPMFIIVMISRGVGGI